MKRSNQNIENLLKESRYGAVDLLENADHQFSHSEDVTRVISNLKDPKILEEELSKYDHFDSNSAFLLVQKRAKAIRRKHQFQIAIGVAASVAAIAVMIYFVNPLDRWMDKNSIETKIAEVEQCNVLIPEHKFKALLIDDNGVEKEIHSGMKEVKIDDIIIENDSENSLLSYENSAPKNSTINQLRVSKGNVYQVILQDGTKVTLNGDSYLKYPTSFSKDRRDVELIGEALFEVTKNENSPFHVKTERGTIQVFGTVFNVKSYRDESTTDVTLLSGSVAYGNQNSVVKIKPGEQASSSSLTSKIHISKVDMMRSIAWTKNMFDYENAPLSVVINDINRSYNSTITIATIGLQEMEVTFKISKDKTFEEVLETLEKSEILKVKKIDGNYLLTKK